MNTDANSRDYARQFRRLTAPRNADRGTGHMPLIACAEGDQFPVIGRRGAEGNYEERLRGDVVTLEAT